MDKACHDALNDLGLKCAVLISLEDFESGDSLLLKAKVNRNKIEYYFTCTPSLPIYIMNHYKEADMITYLDSDLYFFSDPKAVFDEIGANSVSIIPHRWSQVLKANEQLGIYNVGWLSFRRDAQGLACLNWWRDKCLEWCYSAVEPGRYLDQKYLDEWPERFKGVKVVENKGANLAPWNIGNHRCTFKGRDVFVDGQLLVFFHFSGLKKIESWLYNPNAYSTVHKIKPSGLLLQKVYAPYFRSLFEVKRLISVIKGDLPVVLPSANPENITFFRKSARNVRKFYFRIKGVLSKEYVLVLRGRLIAI
ncbi:MAG: glycosyl transferase [Candidatus Omnitrophica bacterium]|nr:glycosyl transferase [Candidatus Omnitrophota bacterium]